MSQSTTNNYQTFIIIRQPNAKDTS